MTGYYFGDDRAWFSVFYFQHFISHYCQIKKYTAEGQFVAAWNAYCWDITVDTNGFVYCADTEPYLQYTGPNQRILQFTADGQFVDT